MTTKELSRWHQDTDMWVWRVYDNIIDDKTRAQSARDTTNIYIVPFEGKWKLIDSEELMGKKWRDQWVQLVKEGGGLLIAGPFDTLDAAKAAWRVIYG